MSSSRLRSADIDGYISLLEGLDLLMSGRGIIQNKEMRVVRCSVG